MKAGAEYEAKVSVDNNKLKRTSFIQVLNAITKNEVVNKNAVDYVVERGWFSTCFYYNDAHERDDVIRDREKRYIPLLDELPLGMPLLWV